MSRFERGDLTIAAEIQKGDFILEGSSSASLNLSGGDVTLTINEKPSVDIISDLNSLAVTMIDNSKLEVEGKVNTFKAKALGGRILAKKLVAIDAELNNKGNGPDGGAIFTGLGSRPVR